MPHIDEMADLLQWRNLGNMIVSQPEHHSHKNLDQTPSWECASSFPVEQPEAGVITWGNYAQSQRANTSGAKGKDGFVQPSLLITSQKQSKLNPAEETMREMFLRQW